MKMEICESSRWQISIIFLFITSATAFQLPTSQRISSHQILTSSRPSSGRLYQSADNADSDQLVKENPSFADNLLSSKSLLDGAENVLKVQDAVEASQTNQGALNQRLFMGAALIATSAALAQGAQLQFQAAAAVGSDYGNLGWESTPVNKRMGVTVFDAEKAGYNVRFVTCLSRFLLVFDVDCQRWWY
jgi:hypothetical protein